MESTEANLNKDVPPIPNEQQVSPANQYGQQYPEQQFANVQYLHQSGQHYQPQLDGQYYQPENHIYPQPTFANAPQSIVEENAPVDHQVFMDNVPIPEQLVAETMHFRNSVIVDSVTGKKLDPYQSNPLPISDSMLYTDTAQSSVYSTTMPFNDLERNKEIVPTNELNGPVALLKDDFHDEKSLDRQRFCFCFHKRWQCLSFFALILIILGVLIYLAIPGLPSFDVSDPYIPPGGAGLQVVQNPEAAVTLNVNEDYSVYSPSYFTWAIHQLKVDLTLKDLNGQLIPAAKGFSTLDDLRFVARSTTNFTVPLMLRYLIPTGFNSGTDSVVQVLVGCTSNPPKQISTQVKITLDISSISWLGIKPSFTYDLKQKCPPGLGSILNQLQGVTTP